MFRALLWKEWRQLALIRWGGVGLGALLPLAFTAGAELSARGLLPTGRVTGYAPRDLMYELLPAALALGLWPLIGLMSAVQAFAGDRAAGTEPFLLERPVPRTRTWCARLAASFLTLTVVLAGTAAIAAAAAAIAGVPPSTGWLRWVAITSSGVGIGSLAYLGGVIGASLLSAPLGALLLGAVLGAIPVLLAAQLSIMFSYAAIGRFTLGLYVPTLLIPAFVVASWLACCRGEPAGRGRLKRALALLGASLAGVLLLFVVLAPVVVRANARLGNHSVQPAPSGNLAFVGAIRGAGWGGGWLVDVSTGARRQFFPPPVSEIAWRPDSSQIAILTWSAPLGGVRGCQRIDIRSTDDGRLLRSFPLDDDSAAGGLAWADGGLVAVVAREKSKTPYEVEIEVLDPARGLRRSTGFRSQGWSVGLVGPVADGRVFARTTVSSKSGDGRFIPRGYQLQPVDLVGARLGPPLADASGKPITFGGWPLGLSRSGLFAKIVDVEDELAEPRIVDLRPNAGPGSMPVAFGARWLPGDRLVWLNDLGERKRMFTGAPGAAPTALREWRNASVGLEPSPDGRAVFVSVLPGQPESPNPKRRAPDPALFEGSVTAGTVPEELIYLPDENRFVSLGPPFSDRANDQRYTVWAGERTLARIGLGLVAFEDIDAPAKRRYVIGGPR
jgi:ABC-type transport system involved in multi-copper enzyme maturation permease subunit